MSTADGYRIDRYQQARALVAEMFPVVGGAAKAGSRSNDNCQRYMSRRPMGKPSVPRTRLTLHDNDERDPDGAGVWGIRCSLTVEGWVVGA